MSNNVVEITRTKETEKIFDLCMQMSLAKGMLEPVQKQLEGLTEDFTYHKRKFWREVETLLRDQKSVMSLVPDKTDMNKITIVIGDDKHMGDLKSFLSLFK